MSRGEITWKTVVDGLEMAALHGFDVERFVYEERVKRREGWIRKQKELMAYYNADGMSEESKAKIKAEVGRLDKLINGNGKH